MAEVKGSLLAGVVRLIRANKDKDWRKYFTEKDMEIIESQILPSSWYPLDTYERAEIAVFKEIAQGKLDVARAWGRFLIEDIIKNVYQTLVDEKDPKISLERFVMFRKQLFRFNDPNFQAIEFKSKAPGQVHVTLRAHHPLPEFEAYCHQAMGSFERLVEMAGAREAKAIIMEYDWKSQIPWATIEISWK